LSEKVLSARGSLDEFKVVVPAKTLLEVARIFSNSDEPIKLVLNTLENQAVFEAKEITVYTRVIDGQFPDYKKLIPEATILNAEFDTQELLEAVKLTNVFAKDVGSIIKVHFNPEGKIKLTSFAQETGENHSEFEAEVTGEMFEVSYNSKYLLDFLNNIKAERLMFGSNGALTPGIIRDAGDTGYIHLIMPVRIES